jgi:heat shock protein HtpX
MSAAHPRWRNRLQSTLLLLAMGLVWALLGWMLAGRDGMLLLLVVGVIALLFGVWSAPAAVMVMYRARPLSPRQAPRLHYLMEELSRRAGLDAVPALFYVPSRLVSAFSVGTGERTVIALSDGLLRNLSLRELAGVMAHELSHVQHHDTWVMALADLVSRMTHFLSLFGQLLLLLNLPLLLFTDYSIPWLLVILLILAPGITALLQLALSRQREYDADAGAAALTGDPLGLAAALQRLEQADASWLDHLFMPGRRVPEPSLLRTHPPTEERVRRLRAMAAESAEAWWEGEQAGEGLHGGPPVDRRPRRNLFGLWY